MGTREENALQNRPPKRRRRSRNRLCLQGPPPAWLSPSLPGGEQSGGVGAPGCTAWSWRALPCFTVWAGPGLIPPSASWTKWGPHGGRQGPCCDGEEDREALSTRRGKGFGVGSSQAGILRLCGCDHPSPEGVSGGVWHPASEPTKP